MLKSSEAPTAAHAAGKRGLHLLISSRDAPVSPRVAADDSSRNSTANPAKTPMPAQRPKAVSQLTFKAIRLTKAEKNPTKPPARIEIIAM